MNRREGMSYTAAVRDGADALSSAVNGFVTPAAYKALRDAGRRYRRAVEDMTSGPADRRGWTWTEEWQAGCERRADRAEDRMLEVLANDFPKPTEGAWGLRLNADPRSCVVYVMRPDGAYNTWGGAENGWGLDL